MEIKYEIKENVGVISENKNGWKLELNVIAWNNHDPKYDIRSWNANHDKMGKGITLTADELKKIFELVKDKI